MGKEPEDGAKEPIVVRRVVDVSEMTANAEETKVEILAKQVALTCFSEENYMAVPIGIFFPTVDGSTILEGGITEATARSKVVALLGKGAVLSDEIWKEAISLAREGQKVLFAVDAYKSVADGQVISKQSIVIVKEKKEDARFQRAR